MRTDTNNVKKELEIFANEHQIAKQRLEELMAKLAKANKSTKTRSRSKAAAFKQEVLERMGAKALTAPDLAKLEGLDKIAVNNTLHSLEREGKVERAGIADSRTKGRKPTIWRVK